jgi:hypothetical protein
MKMNRRTTMAGTVFVAALATGYVTIDPEALASRFVMSSSDAGPKAQQPIQAASAETVPVAYADAVPAMPAEPAVVTLELPAPEMFGDRVPVADNGAGSEAVAETDAFSPFGLRCDTTLKAEPGPAATVQLRLSAPCHGGEAVTIRHEGLHFTDVTGSDGILMELIPALANEATFEVTLADGTMVETTLEVPKAETYERVALQWQGQAGLELHAFEFGANYGDAGHVHATAPYSPERALRQRAGFLSRLGRETIPGGWVSEVYSYPSAGARERGAIRISIEAEVTAVNCGKAVSAETLLRDAGKPFDTQSLTLSIPGCDAIGQFLVLSDSMPDLAFAAN